MNCESHHRYGEHYAQGLPELVACQGIHLQFTHRAFLWRQRPDMPASGPILTFAYQFQQARLRMLKSKDH